MAIITKSPTAKTETIQTPIGPVHVMREEDYLRGLEAARLVLYMPPKHATSDYACRNIYKWFDARPQA